MTNDPWFDDGHYEISFLQNHSSAIICWHDLIAISDYILPIYIYTILYDENEVHLYTDEQNDV